MAKEKFTFTDYLARSFIMAIIGYVLFVKEPREKGKR